MRLNKLVAVVAIGVLVGLGSIALIFGGPIAGSMIGRGATTSEANHPLNVSQLSSTSNTSGNNSNSFFLAMNVIPTARLVPLGGSTNFTVVLYNGGDLTGGYSLSAAAPSGLSVEFGAIPVAMSGAGPHPGVLHVSSSGEMSPGAYQVTIVATGSKGVANQTFDFHVQRNLVLLKSTGTPTFSNLTVKAGDSVTWVSLDGPNSDESNAFHQIIFSTNNLTSASLLQYESWSHTFTQPGTYRYYDNADPIITGEVIVSP